MRLKEDNKFLNVRNENCSIGVFADGGLESSIQ